MRHGKRRSHSPSASTVARKIDAMSEDIYSLLLNRMRQGDLDRLPPEETLASELGVSRVKLRDVLAALETNGYISRRKGVGTVVNKYLVQEKVRLDIDNVYEEMIEDAGFRPHTEILKLIKLNQTPDFVAKKLERDQDAAIQYIEKLVFADAKPAIYLEDYIPLPYFRSDDIDLTMLAKSTFGFVQRKLRDRLENMVVSLKAENADERIAEKLQINTTCAVLRLDAVTYSRRHLPILYSIEYHNTNRLPYSLHKWLRRTQYIVSE